MGPLKPDTARRITREGALQRNVRIQLREQLAALDPSQAANRQQLWFRAQGAARLEWRLDGVRMGHAAREIAWVPPPGRHKLELVDTQDRVLAHHSFEVRGAVRR